MTRYNDEASKKLGTAHERMFAVTGNLTLPAAELEGSEWFNFDTAIMSMALHHVPDPVSMLVALRKRLRSGGSIILVEWLKDPSPNTSNNPAPEEGEEKMIETIGGQRVWPGFDGEYLRRHLQDAGFEKETIEVRVPGVKFYVPEHLGRALRGGENDLVFVRAVAP